MCSYIYNSSSVKRFMDSYYLAFYPSVDDAFQNGALSTTNTPADYFQLFTVAGAGSPPPLSFDNPTAPTSVSMYDSTWGTPQRYYEYTTRPTSFPSTSNEWSATEGYNGPPASLQTQLLSPSTTSLDELGNGSRYELPLTEFGTASHVVFQVRFRILCSSRSQELTSCLADLFQWPSYDLCVSTGFIYSISGKPRDFSQVDAPDMSSSLLYIADICIPFGYRPGTGAYRALWYLGCAVRG